MAQLRDCFFNLSRRLPAVTSVPVWTTAAEDIVELMPDACRH